MRGATTRSISIAAVENGENAVHYEILLDETTYAHVDGEGKLNFRIAGSVWKIDGDARTAFPVDEDTLQMPDWQGGWEGLSEYEGNTFVDDLSDYMEDVKWADFGSPRTIALRLVVGGDVVATSSVPVSVDGLNGNDVVRCDFEDEQWMVPCDGEGKAVGTFPAWSTTGHLYVGTEAQALDASRCTLTQGVAGALVAQLTVSGTAASVAVTGFGADSSEVNTLTVTLADGAGHEASQVLKVVKTTLPTVYQLRLGATVIKAGKDGSREPADFLAVGAAKISGGMVSDVDFTGQVVGETVAVKAQWKKNGTGSWTDCGEKQDSQGRIQRYTYGVNLDGTETKLALRLVSNDGEAFVYDEETVPVVSDGAKGDDAVMYEIVLDEDSVAEISASGATLAVVSGYVYKTEGGVRAAYVPADGARLQIYDLEEQDNWDDLSVDNDGHFFSDGWTAMHESDYVHKDALRLRLVDGLGTLLATAQLAFNKAGSAGPRGYDGLIIRTTEWEQGKEYRNDTGVTPAADGRRYLDIVTISNFNDESSDDFMSAATYVCKITHESTERSPKKPAPNSAYWELMSETGPIKTPLIWAARALLSFLQVHQVTITNLEGDVIGAIGSDSQFPIKFGTNITDPTKINFSVSAAGKMYCVGADIHGNVTIKDDDGLVVYDSNGDVRIRISAQDIDKPPTDAPHSVVIMKGNSIVGTENDIDCLNGRMTIDGQQGDFAMGSGQHVGGTLRFSLSDGQGTFGTVIGSNPPVLTTGISLIDTATGLVVADDSIVRELSSGDLLANMQVEVLSNTKVGQYMSTRSMRFALLVSVVMKNVTAGNFSLYEKASSDGVSCRLEVTGMEVSAKASVTLLGPNGLCVNAGANKHILMDGDGIVLRWGRAGLRLSGNKGSEVIERLMADGLTWLPLNAMKVRSVSGNSCTVLKDDDYIIWNQSGASTLFFSTDAGWEGHRVTIKPNQRNISFNSEKVCGWSDAIGDYTSSYNGSRPFALTYYNGWWYAEKLGD